MSGLAPSLGDGAPARIPLRQVALAGAAALLAATLFWAPLLFGGALHGYDWQSHHYHYFDWVRIALQQYGTLPLYMADAWVTPNFLANAESPSLGPLAWLLLVLPTGVYIKLLLVLFTALGLAGMYLLLRDLSVAPPLAVLAALGFCWGAFFSSHVGVGHPWAMGGYLLPVLLLLFRRAALGSDAALVGAAFLNAATILGGQHQPFVWQNLLLSGFAAFWALRVRASFPLWRWGLLLALSAALAAVKLLPLWLEFSDYAPQARIPGLPVAALWTTLLARGQGPSWAEPGLPYAFGAGWWEYAFYVGPVALLCLVAGLLAARRAWPLWAVGLFFLLLAIEPSPWHLLRDLPVWRSQRGASRFLFPALFCFWVAAAVGLERLRALAAARRPGLPVALAWALALLVGADLYWESRAWQAAALGPALQSLDHRPRPLRVAGPGLRAELTGFAPNHLVYRVESRSGGVLRLPLRYGKDGAEWRSEAWEPLRRDDRLAFELPAGVHELALDYRPPGLAAGAALSLAGLLAGLGLPAWRRSR